MAAVFFWGVIIMMTIDQDITTSLVSVFTGLAIGVTVEALMPPESSASSVAEIMFEASVQVALLVIVSELLIKPGHVPNAGLVTYGMALGAAQLGLLMKLRQLAVEAKKAGQSLLQRMGPQLPVAPAATSTVPSS